MLPKLDMLPNVIPELKFGMICGPVPPVEGARPAGWAWVASGASRKTPPRISTPKRTISLRSQEYMSGTSRCRSAPAVGSAAPVPTAVVSVWLQSLPLLPPFTLKRGPPVVQAGNPPNEEKGAGPSGKTPCAGELAPAFSPRVEKSASLFFSGGPAPGAVQQKRDRFRLPRACLLGTPREITHAACR